MQIIGFSSTDSNPQVLNPILFGKLATTAVAAVRPEATAQPSAPPANAAPAVPATNVRRTTQTHGASAAGGGAAAAAVTEMQVSSYSTMVNGTQYSGSIVESGGQYTASVPSLPGATATGTSITAAENSLDLRIDELV
jgi:hypothetical protein